VRYLLDTNVIAFIMSGEYDNISSDVSSIIKDYNNLLYISSVSITELLQLYRIRKIKPKEYKAAQQLQEAVEKDFFITILPFAKEHTLTLAKLKIADGHKDPFDHSIIAQAITEKLTLISSDRKFEEYTSQKLSFVFNRR